MKALKTVRVYVAAGEGVDDARRAVADVMEMLNRHFRPRGVEFVGAAEGEGDWKIALYWKDFGGMGREEFETVYERFKKEKKPVIHVFFKEPDEGIGEALKAFKEAFAERYGHFYCHFETVDAVRFQLAAQSLSMLPGGAGERDALSVEDGVVRLGREPVAKMENLSFAKLNRKRKNLLEDIAQIEIRVAKLENEATEAPDDADLQEALREARMKRLDLEEELKQHDGFLFSVAVSFAKAMSEETSERTRKAWELFQQGKVQEANKLLDWDVLKESTERNRKLFHAQKETYETNLQEYLAKAKIVMADDSMTMTERGDAASRAYDEAIAIAREIHWEDKKLAEIVFNHGYLLGMFRKNTLSVKRYSEALALYRKLAEMNPAAYDADIALTLNNLANHHVDSNHLEEAKCEYVEALELYRKLKERYSGVYDADEARILMGLASLHFSTHRLSDAAIEYSEAQRIYQSLLANAATTCVAEEYVLFEEGLAQSLDGLAFVHKNMQHFKDAEEEYTEAKLICLALAAAYPSEEHEVLLARVLHNHASLLQDVHQLTEAESEYRKALEIRYQLEKSRPGAYSSNLAMTLNNLANVHQDMRKWEEAEGEYAQAIDICRHLAAREPESFEPDLAIALNNFANMHYLQKQFSKAEQEYVEALEIRRKWANMQPDKFNLDLADTLNNLANLYCSLQRLEDAESRYVDAIEIYRKVSVLNPLAHEFSLAQILQNIANLHKFTGQIDKAASECNEALEIFRRLSSQNHGMYDSFVAGSLNDLSLLHCKMKRFSEAESECNEGLLIRRRLQKENPTAHAGTLVASLYNLSVIHAQTGMVADAIATAEEAKTICEQYHRLMGEQLDGVKRLIESLKRSKNESEDKEMNKAETSKAVRHHLDERGIPYEYDAERQCLMMRFKLHCNLQGVPLYVYFLDGGYAMYGIAPIKADGVGLGEVLKYTAMINYGLVPGNFEVDVSDGEIRFKIWTRTKGAERLLGEVIEECFRFVHGVFERFGDGFVALVAGEADAETEYKKALGESA